VELRAGLGAIPRSKIHLFFGRRIPVPYTVNCHYSGLCVSVSVYMPLHTGCLKVILYIQGPKIIFYLQCAPI
jgi:hypothetical protein